MPSEPNLRSFENAFSGRPYGYGLVPTAKLPKRPGAGPTADSRPQQFATPWARSGELAVCSQPSLPGFWISFAGLLVSPLRWLRWAFTTPGVRVAALVFVIIGFLGVACVPLITSSGRNPRRAECTQLLCMSRQVLRDEYWKSKSKPKAIDAFHAAVSEGQFAGKYYVIEHRLVPTDGRRIRVYAHPVSSSDPAMYIEFEWESGWHQIDYVEKDSR